MSPGSRSTFLCTALALGGLLTARPANADFIEPASMTIHLDANGISIDNAAGAAGAPLAIHFDGAGIVHVRSGVAVAPPALVLDPRLERTHVPVKLHEDAHAVTMTSSQLSATWNKDNGTLSVDDAGGRHLLTLYPAMLGEGKIALTHAQDDALYGIHGFDATEPATIGLLRQGSQLASAGEQGNAGAPFVWSTTGYGVLVDTDGKLDFQEVTPHATPLGDDSQNGAHQQLARLDIQPKIATRTTKPAMDFYILVGEPRELFGELAGLSGHTPLFPKWAMGFTNSQWGIDQKELLQIVDTYRAKHIPLDNFTLDFDWKAWGDDDYGEFRWNATKFPDGPDGKLKAELDRRGIHLTGIMKPRMHVDTVEGRYARRMTCGVRTSRPRRIISRTSR